MGDMYAPTYRDRLHLLRLIWRNWRRRDDGDWYLPLRWALIYRLKGSACVLLGRTLDGVGNTAAWPERDAFGLACYDYEEGYDYEFGRTWAWTTLKVGMGWRDWWFYELTDGGP